MKNIFKTIAFLAIVGLVFTGCQKDEGLVSTPQVQPKMVSIWELCPEIAYLEGNRVAKADIQKIKERVVNINGSKLKSFEIGSLEWTDFDNENASVTAKNKFQFPYKTAGMTPNGYYKYQQASMPSFINPLAGTGWRIPTLADMQNLIIECGGDETIITMILGLPDQTGAHVIYSSTYQPYDPMNNDAIFWANQSVSPDGYYKGFRFHNGGLWYSDIAGSYACKVRLVRNI